MHRSPSNQKFGKLLATEDFIRKEMSGRLRNFYKCICDCGNVVYVNADSLFSGGRKSCGCLNTKFKIKHGMFGTRFYNIWNGIRNRCTNPNSKDYPEYGGRLCERWYSFINFFEDNFKDYEKHVAEFGEKNTTADRFPNCTGIYDASNFRWATLSEQNRNRICSTITDDYENHYNWRKRLKTLTNNVIHRKQKTSKFLEPYLGCSLPEFFQYIESRFLPGMTWDNYGNEKGKWNLDHIIGCNNFDLSKEKDRKDCWNFKNLRPMWYEDHLKKSRLRV
jgi:hypothetical protein